MEANTVLPQIPHRIVGEKRHEIVVNEAMKHHGQIFPIAILKKTMLRNLHVMMLTTVEVKCKKRLPWDFQQEKIVNHLKFVL